MSENNVGDGAKPSKYSHTMNTAKEIKDSISCVDCFNALCYCMGPKHQFDQYWREGQFDMCRRPMREMKFCLKLKMASPQETKKLAKHLLKEDPSPTEGVIWEPRHTNKSKQ
eukprot:gb/GECG01003571.1/.p1 GENE.gb/GECG01003571.1/~~gb/GECG01003571.1/.p1  ORF type:complete len:112 (+),score=14.18 gb/GECG01003571.1/:1-336(+)